MNRKRIRKWALALLFLLLAVGILTFADRLLTPKYMSVSKEGALTAEYYRDTDTGHQVLFLGDCEVYESFTPPTLWEKYGVSSYIRGNAQQLIWQSYYLLEETFRYESPRVVVFNVFAMKYGEPQNDAYNRMTLDGMKLSATKLRAVRASMTKEESLASYLFPLLRFHSRWKELSGEDFTYLFRRDTVSHNGYLMQTGVEPMVGEEATPPTLWDPALPKVCFDYLDRMRALCEEHGAELVLIKSPTDSWRYHWYDEWDTQVAEYAAAHSLHYYNFIPLSDEIGIDWSTDTYDAGVHLNVSGAEKLTSYFGAILKETFDLTDERVSDHLSTVWNGKIDAYYKEKEEKSHETK